MTYILVYECAFVKYNVLRVGFMNHVPGSKKELSMKKRDFSLDIIRIIAIFMIVVFHFAGIYNEPDSVFLLHANGSWGSLGTAMFFILSGYLLRIRYKNIGSIKNFYFKRWLSIYPAFYIAFIVAFLVNAIRLRYLFYMGPWYRLIYTVLGIDNYLIWFNVETYAAVGEWFTAVIVVLYIVFPLLNKIMNHYKWSAMLIFSIFYAFYVHFGLYPKVAEISFVACGYMFWVGMLLAEHEKLIKKNYIVGIITLTLAVIFLFIKINIIGVFAVHALAILLFVSLLNLLNKVNETKKSLRALTYLSEISYAVYLVHHYILNNLYLVEKKVPALNSINLFVKFVLYLIFVIVSAAVLEFITSHITKFCLRNTK